jgi:hypothetical protein
MALQRALSLFQQERPSRGRFSLRSKPNSLFQQERGALEKGLRGPSGRGAEKEVGGATEQLNRSPLRESKERAKSWVCYATRISPSMASLAGTERGLFALFPLDGRGLFAKPSSPKGEEQPSSPKRFSPSLFAKPLVGLLGQRKEGPLCAVPVSQ